jgi:hypothetical protein
MVKKEAAVFEDSGPSKEFWEDDLEFGLEPILAAVQQNGHVQEWIDRRTGRQLGILCTALGVPGDGSTRKKRAAVQGQDEGLTPYLLVERFTQYKSKVAVTDFARAVLPQETLQACQKDEDGKDYDTAALMFAIYLRKWSDLRLVYHLDKIHKTGFARMKLQDTPRRPQQEFKDFLQAKSVKTILAEFDKARGDGLTSEFKDVIVHDKRHLVFVRRANRPDHLVKRTGGVMHGYKSEWIILDFDDGAKHVNISSVSVDVPLEIANRLASGYFGKQVEYDNESRVTYTKQVHRFLGQVKDVKAGVLVLVEVVAGNSPLDGAPKIKISDPGSGSVGTAVGHFEKAIGGFLADIEHLESIKVLFHKKRVSLLFEKVEDTDGEYVVRYSDHRLNAGERREFEKHMEDTHGIAVLSTEKRFKQPS